MTFSAPQQSQESSESVAMASSPAPIATPGGTGSRASCQSSLDEELPIDLTHLTVEEQRHILAVMARDEALRKMQERRILHLKAELQRLRKRGALRPGLDPERTCARCLSSLGRVLNRGAQCPICRKKVCKDCRLFENGVESTSTHWICVLCQKQLELKATSGQWMQDSPTTFQGSIRRRSLQGSPPVIVSPVFSAPNSSPATPQHPSHLPAGATVLPSPAVALHQANPEFIPRRYLAAQAYYKLQQQSNGSAVPSAPLKFGPGFDSPQRAAAPPSRSQSPSATPRRSPGRSSSVQSSSPSPSPSPSLNGVPIRWAPIRSPIHKRQTSSLSSLSSDASFNQQGPLRVDERAVDCGRPASDPQGNAKATSPVPSPRRGRKQGEASPSNNKPPRAGPGRPSQQAQGVGAHSPRGTAPFNNNSSTSTQASNLAVGTPAQKSRSSSPTNSEAGSKNDESVIFRRVTIKKKPEPSTQTNETPTRRFNRTECDADDSNGSPLRSARFRGARKGPPGTLGSDVESGASTDNLHQMGVFSKSQTSLSTLGNLSVSHPGGRSESMTSVYSAAGGGRYGTVDITGEVNFGLSYDLKQGMLNVQVKECKNLAAVDEKRNRSDPYVKVYLLPDRSKAGKRKTKVRKHTLNPVFNETLRFSVERSELTSRTLWLSVWHSDMFGRNDFLGEVMKDLSSDMLETNTTHWYPLQERMDPLDGASNVTYKGELMLSLKFAPHDHRPGKGSLHVIVKEASNLQATRSNGTSDPFCKCYLLPDRHKSGKQKTAVVRRSVAPVWNHPFVYHDVSVEELQERCLELTIWDYDKITSNDFLGGVRLCLGTSRYQGITVDWMDSQGEEIRLWRQMLEKPNQWIDGCLHLRSSMN